MEEKNGGRRIGLIDERPSAVPACCALLRVMCVAWPGNWEEEEAEAINQSINLMLGTWEMGAAARGTRLRGWICVGNGRLWVMEYWTRGKWRFELL